MIKGTEHISEKIAEEFQKQMEDRREDTGVREKVEDDVVSKFEKAMRGSEIDDESMSTEDTSGVKQALDNEGGIEEGPGDEILKGIERLRESHVEKVQKVNQLVEGVENSPMSIQEALKLQFDLLLLSQEQELVSKGADKTSQAVQTMFRNQ